MQDEPYEPVSTPPTALPYHAPAPASTVISCPNCSYNLTGATIGTSCPECGLTIGGGAFSNNSLPTSGKAITSMILGILSLVSCMAYGVPSIIFGPLAIVFAHLAKKQIAEQQVNPNSRGLAIAGLVCGIVGTVFGVIGIGLIVWLIVAMA